MDKALIDKFKNSYGILDELTVAKRIDGYPHVMSLSFGDKEYIVKRVQKIYCKSIETLYNYLSQSRYVELPIKTTDNRYGLMISGELFITYPLCQKPSENIKPEWWAKALRSIHNIDINTKDFSYDYNISEECFSLLKRTKGLFSEKLDRGIIKLLDDYYRGRNVGRIVLSHNDPYDDNVLVDNALFKLIDTDGARLLPEEFDIQKVFHNEVNRETNQDKIDNYIITFFRNYLNYGDSIDMGLLKKLYVIDLLRSLSWLALITRDKTREDYRRQIEELEKFKEGIISGRHHKILERL